MANGNGYTAAEAIKAIRGSKGFVTQIAKRLGCTRKTVYNLMDRYPTVKEAVDDEREQIKDFAESKLFRMIDNEVPAAVFFYLKTQAKDRGYVERQEISGDPDNPIYTKIQVIYADDNANSTETT